MCAHMCVAFLSSSYLVRSCRAHRCTPGQTGICDPAHCSISSGSMLMPASQSILVSTQLCHRNIHCSTTLFVTWWLAKGLTHAKKRLVPQTSAKRRLKKKEKDESPTALPKQCKQKLVIRERNNRLGVKKFPKPTHQKRDKRTDR